MFLNFSSLRTTLFHEGITGGGHLEGPPIRAPRGAGTLPGGGPSRGLNNNNVSTLFDFGNLKRYFI